MSFDVIWYHLMLFVPFLLPCWLRLIGIMLTSFVTANKRQDLRVGESFHWSHSIGFAALPLGVTFQESAWQDESLVCRTWHDMTCHAPIYSDWRPEVLRSNAGAWDVWRLSREESDISGEHMTSIDSLLMAAIWHYHQYDQQVSIWIYVAFLACSAKKFQQKASKSPCVSGGFFSRRWKLTGSSTAGHSFLANRRRIGAGNLWVSELDSNR